MGKNWVFYLVTSTLIGLALEWAGADLAVSFVASLVGPPALLLLILLVRDHVRR